MEEIGYSRRCVCCIYFERYYVIDGYRFDKTEYGRCVKRGGTVRGKDGGCAERRARSAGSSLGRKIVAERALRGIFSEISAIRQIFEEETEERRIGKEQE